MIAALGSDARALWRWTLRSFTLQAYIDIVFAMLQVGSNGHIGAAGTGSHPLATMDPLVVSCVIVKMSIF